MLEVRPFLATIDQHIEDDRASIMVTLGLEEVTFSGTAEGPSDSAYRARLVGEATLRAVEAIVGGSTSFDLTAVGTSDLGPVKIALAQVREEGFAEYLIGSALVRGGDPGAATAKAVLDAINRRIARH
jgi:hypothetical protein